MNIQVETLGTSLNEMKPLLEEHYQEIALYKDKIKLNPDYEKYYALERNNNLCVFTVREEGKLIGYSIFFVFHHLHYSDCLTASNDIVFISKKFRKGMAAIKLFKFAETHLINMGVAVINYHIKFSNDIKALMDRLEYKDDVEKIYSKFVLKEVK